MDIFGLGHSSFFIVYVVTFAYDFKLDMKKRKCLIDIFVTHILIFTLFVSIFPLTFIILGRFLCNEIYILHLILQLATI
jgi:hypothetical protein